MGSSEQSTVTLRTVATPQRKPSLAARLRATIPPEPAASPVRYSAPLVAYVVAICALAFVIALLTVRAPSDTATLLLGALVIFALGLVMVRSFGGVDAPWSPTAFIHLALSFAFGPVGALAAAVAATVATAIRLRAGWFRTLLNLPNLFLVNIAAYAVFHALTRTATSDLWLVALDGMCAGAASYAVNSVVLCGAIRLASGVPVWTFLRSTISVFPYDLGYGLGAAGFFLYFVEGGSPYLVMWLAPVVVFQGFLILLAVRTNAHAADREQLLQRIVTGEEDHRAKSAADLHDGPYRIWSGSGCCSAPSRLAFPPMLTARSTRSQRNCKGCSTIYARTYSSFHHTDSRSPADCAKKSQPTKSKRCASAESTCTLRYPTWFRSTARRSNSYIVCAAKCSQTWPVTREHNTSLLLSL